MRSDRGYTLAEILTAIAVLGLFVAVALPQFTQLRRRAAVRQAATEIRSIFHLARARAIARHANAGVKFIKVDDRDEWQYAIYDDGDGDGVRNEDIRSRVDREFLSPRFLWHQPNIVSVRLPDFPIVDPDGDPVRADATAVQFNRSTLCAFSHLGQATSGTIYLTDSAGEVYAVRVYGATAKMRVLRYNRAKQKWEGQK